ncbi:MAG: hypothetical protein ACRC0V_07150 [Fusobacteriaceae bacterium]
MKEKTNKNIVLNQHSALTTFQLNEGKYFTTGVEKSIFALLFRSQQDMINSFRNNLRTNLTNIIKEKNIETLIDWIYTGKEFEISIDELLVNELFETTKKIAEYRKQEVMKKTGVTEERKKLLKSFEKTKLFQLLGLKEEIKLLKNENQLTLEIFEKSLKGKNIEKTSENIKELLGEIKEYCKDISVKEHMELKTIDLTTLSNSIETNLTYLKKDLKEAVGTKLKFNYINKKKLDVDVVSTLIASVSFENDKSKKTTWLSYQIPIEILKLLLIPEIYVPLNGIVIKNIKGIYSFRMYGFLKDHIKRGEVELTKNEIFTFFMLPKSYEKKTHFINKFLEPTLYEVEINSGIKAEYEFIPSRNWEKIRFKMRRDTEIIVPEIRVVTAEDAKKDIVDSENKILSGIAKMKKNIYVSKSWNKYSENKIHKLAKETNIDFAVKIMNLVYESLNSEINTTLVKYINGILKKIENQGVEEIVKRGRKKIMKQKTLETDTVFESTIQEKVEKISENTYENYTKLKNDFQDLNMSNFVYSMFLDMKEEKQQEVIKEAKKLYQEKTGSEILGKIQEKMYKASEKNLIAEILTKKSS